MKNFNMKLNKKLTLFLILFCSLFINNSWSQLSIIWMAAGSLQNWYSKYACEIELGNNPSQSEEQYGLRWPSIYTYQDIQCAKGMWIGTRNFKDAAGKNWSTKSRCIC